MNRIRRLPVRWRLALISSGITFLILLAFAVVIGELAKRQVTNSFDSDLKLTAALVIIVGVLVIRPSGLFGHPIATRV